MRLSGYLPRLSRVLTLDRLPPRVRGVVWAVLAVVVALVIVPALFPHRAPSGLILQGVEFGAIDGLLALGLVLTYRANRIVNFSYGAMGGVAGTLGVMLTLGQHWNWFLAMLVGLAAGAVLGAAVELLVVRRFFNAPRLILTVATIGLAQVLGGIQFLMPGWLHGPPIVGGLTTPLSAPHIRIQTFVFHGDDLLIAIAVPVVLVGLGWFLTRTDAGVAVRSVSDNADRAMLLGIPIRRLSTLVWTIAGVLSALTVLLSAPSQGLTITAGAGPALLLPALAAAVVARMESLPVAFAAGVGLGVLNQVVGFNITKESTNSVVFLIVILVALLVQRRRAGRAEGGDESWSATGVLKPIPDLLRRLPEVRAARFGLGGAVLLAVVVAPYAFGPGTTLQFTFAIIYAIVAVSLVVLSGWAGNISLGQFAFAGVGGVVAGDLVAKFNVDFFVSLTAAAAVGAALALVVGLPALRIRGLYLAVTTLALAVAANDFFFNPTNFEHLLPGAGSSPSVVAPVLWKRFDLASSSGRAYYFFCLAVLALAIVFVKGLRRARAGRVLLAVRDNERASAAMSVPNIHVKLVGFMLAGAMAGIAGALHATALGSVGKETYSPSISVLVFAMAVIGGLGSISGAILGVTLIELLTHFLPQYSLIITGAGLLWILSALPGGIGEALVRVRDRLLRVVAERRHLVVPNLVADRAVTLTDHAPHEEALLAAALSDPAAAKEAAASVVAQAEEVVDSAARAGHGIDPAGPPPLLRCREVEVSYGSVQVLFGVDLDVQPGEIVALLGTNGAGKSTLLKAVCGLVRTGNGDVELGGEAIANVAADKVAHKGIALMPGGRGVFPTLTVDENLRLGCWLIRKDKSRCSVERRRILELFPVLGQRAHQQAGNLSGGEQQMLSLGMALLVRPDLLLIDELSLGLAPTVVSQLLEVVRMLHAQGTTIVLVEQSVNVALELAERAVFLEKGEVRFTGPTAELLERPDILRSVFIAGADVLTSGPEATSVAGATAASQTVGVGHAAGAQPAADATGTGTGTGAERTDGAEDANSTAAAPRQAPSSQVAVILECREVAKHFGGIRAVDGVSLQLREGEILGLIGHNGAGKTTLFDCVSGFLPLDGGRIRLGGMDIGEWPAHLRAAAGIGRTFQEARLFPSLTVQETIAVSLERHLRSKGLVAAGLRLPASLDSEAEAWKRVDQLVDAMGLGAFAEKLVGELSTGTRRIVELACVLAQDPAVVLLDEPSGGVAQRETEALGPLLVRVQQMTGCSLLVIEHDMPLLTAICDRMIALELGEVIAEGTPGKVLEHPAVIESYLGTDDTAIKRSGARTG
jgi:ABC-type branched-subunit amino acid transport system ATPase component/ABC-type branched-subunit amino acid transport system permease subunit